MTTTTRKVTGVTATSAVNPDVVGEGADAAAAVKDMHAKLAAKKAKAEAPATSLEERIGPTEELPAGETPPVPPPNPSKVTREG